MNKRFSHIWLCLLVFAGHYRKAPLQAGAIILGITLAVTLLTGVRAINENAKRSYGEATEKLSQKADWLITPSAGRVTLDETVYFDIRSAGYSMSLAIVEGELTSEEDGRWQVQGSDLIAAMTVVVRDPKDDRQSNKKLLSSEQIPVERMLAGESVALMSQNQVDMLSGPYLTLSGQRIEIIPLDESLNINSHIVMDISLAQKLLGREGQLSYIALFGDITNELTSLKALIAGRAQLQRSDQGESIAALTQSFHLNLTAMSMLAFMVGLFIAYNGVRYSLQKRQRLLVQLQQLGMTRVDLLLALCIELSLLVVVGSLVGFIFGLQLSHWLHPMISVTLEQLYNASILPGIWRWSWLWQALLLTLLASILACCSLFIQMLSQPLARSSGLLYQQQNASLAHKIQFAIAAILALIVLVQLPFSHDYRYTMGLLGLVVVAIPLALPRALMVMVNLVARFSPKGLIGYLVAETKELIAFMTLAMMAMLLAVTANIAMNTLVGSFESTLINWLNVRLHADLYVRPAPSEVAKVEQFLKAEPQVSAVYRQYTQSSRYGELPILLRTKDPETLRKTAIFKSALADIWPRFFSGEMVIISEPMAIRQGLVVGDAIELAEIEGRSFTVGGVFYDYGNPYGKVVIDPDTWNEHHLSSLSEGLGVSFQGDPDGLRNRLKQYFKIPDALIFDQSQIKQQAMTMFTKTFGITRALNSLTLLVAAIGLFSACFMLTQARVAPIARLYSLGVTRTELAWMVLGQMLLIVLLTCLVALPAGWVLGYMLIHHVTLQAFGWSIVMLWEWRMYGEVVALALFASLLAVALPLYQQTRKPLISSLQREVL